GLRVSGYPVIGVVPRQLADQSMELLWHTQVPILSTPVSQGADTSPQPLGRGLPLDDPTTRLRFAPIVGKAQKVEGFRFLQQLAIGSLTSGPSERDQSCL